MKLNQKICIIATAAILGLALAGCGAGKEEGFDPSQEIGVFSREEGSGTRGAFVELFGVEQKDGQGEKRDYTTLGAVITNSTSVMMTAVASDKYAIGYISLGSLNDTVRALEIDGAAATVENIENNSYKIVRPFNIATLGSPGPEASDFLDFILSGDGQQVVADSGYIPLSGSAPYVGSVKSGKIVVAGSSSVAPVMEKLKEAYVSLNPGVTIEVQQSDSSTGLASAIDGVCDIAMASRELKDSELEKGLVSTVIAQDGIAVIVNKENPLTSLSSERVRQIFTGDIASWDQAGE